MVLLPACVHWVAVIFFYLFIFKNPKISFKGKRNTRSKGEHTAQHSTTAPEGDAAPQNTARHSKTPRRTRAAPPHHRKPRETPQHTTTHHSTKHQQQRRPNWHRATRRAAQHGTVHTGKVHKPTPPAMENGQQGATAQHHTATQDYGTLDTAQGSGAPQQTTAHSRAASHAARQEHPRQHTQAENNSRLQDPATNSRQPQATTRSTSKRERNNTAPPARHSATAAYHTTGGTPEQHSTAPQDRTQPQATTGDQATATWGSSTEQEPGPTHARHAPTGKTQNTPQHRNRTGNNTHRTGTTREHPTTQRKP